MVPPTAQRFASSAPAYCMRPSTLGGSALRLLHSIHSAYSVCLRSSSDEGKVQVYRSSWRSNNSGGNYEREQIRSCGSKYVHRLSNLYGGLPIEASASRRYRSSPSQPGDDVARVGAYRLPSLRQRTLCECMPGRRAVFRRRPRGRSPGPLHRLFQLRDGLPVRGDRYRWQERGAFSGGPAFHAQVLPDQVRSVLRPRRGPACVEACPTKGLRLVDADYRDEAMRAKRRAAALFEAGVPALELNVALA